MIPWLVAVLVFVALMVSRRLLLGHGHSHHHPARRADCPVVRSGDCPCDHDCEEHS